MAAIKKQFAKGGQFFAEKFGAHKASDKGADYKELSTLVDAYKRYLEEVHSKTIECLEPNPNVRARLITSSALSKLQGRAPNALYPQPEADLAECLSKHGRSIGQFKPFGSALICAGETFAQIAEAKGRSLDESRCGFLRPINETLNQDMKELTHLRKKCESRRLTYDSKRRSMEKGADEVSSAHGIPPPDFDEAKQRFEDSLAEATAAMGNFLDSEVEQIEALNNFVNAQLSCYQDAARFLSDLQRQLQTKLEQARDEASHRSPRPPARISSPISSKSGTWNDVNNGPSNSASGEVEPNFCMKEKHENQRELVPTCQALFDFEAENNFELAFSEGDVIKLIEQVDDNWFLGELNGKRGHFPVTYVRVLVPLP